MSSNGETACKRGKNCKDKDCPFLHPRCFYETRCTAIDCPCVHPNGRKIDGSIRNSVESKDTMQNVAAKTLSKLKKVTVQRGTVIDLRLSASATSASEVRHAEAEGANESHDGAFHFRPVLMKKVSTVHRSSVSNLFDTALPKQDTSDATNQGKWALRGPKSPSLIVGTSL